MNEIVGVVACLPACVGAVGLCITYPHWSIAVLRSRSIVDALQRFTPLASQTLPERADPKDMTTKMDKVRLKMWDATADQVDKHKYIVLERIQVESAGQCRCRTFEGRTALFRHRWSSPRDHTLNKEGRAFQLFKQSFSELEAAFQGREIQDCRGPCVHGDQSIDPRHLARTPSEGAPGPRDQNVTGLLVYCCSQNLCMSKSTT